VDPSVEKNSTRLTRAGLRALADSQQLLNALGLLDLNALVQYRFDLSCVCFVSQCVDPEIDGFNLFKAIAETSPPQYEYFVPVSRHYSQVVPGLILVDLIGQTDYVPLCVGLPRV